MKIYSFTCTRGDELTRTTTELLEYFQRCNIESKLLINKESIFEAYTKELDEIDANLDDIIIMCHDDIQILTDPIIFTQLLEEKLTNPQTGFVGVAGTRTLSRTAVWWDMEEWKKQAHSGFVYHGNDLNNLDATYFGQLGEVVVLDGLFLAATVKTLRSIQTAKPKKTSLNSLPFSGEWDFYDIFYTFQAHLKKLKNYTLPILVRHESIGELAGRESWYANRDAFINRFGKYLPASVR